MGRYKLNVKAINFRCNPEKDRKILRYVELLAANNISISSAIASILILYYVHGTEIEVAKVASDNLIKPRALINVTIPEAQYSMLHEYYTQTGITIPSLIKNALNKCITENSEEYLLSIEELQDLLIKKASSSIISNIDTTNKEESIQQNNNIKPKASLKLIKPNNDKSPDIINQKNDVKRDKDENDRVFENLTKIFGW